MAIARRSRRPFADFLVIGALYGVSLVIVHQLMWTEGLALEHIGIAMMIGLGAGAVVGLIAVVADRWRARRAVSGTPRS